MFQTRNSFIELSPDLPSVSLLQKTPSSPVSCLATGFYPPEPHSSGGKMERSFMRRWTTERSSPTTMEPSRWVLTWTFHQSHLKTGRGTTVCFSSLVWRRKSSPNWRKIRSGPTGVRNTDLTLFWMLDSFSLAFLSVYTLPGQRKIHHQKKIHTL